MEIVYSIATLMSIMGALYVALGRSFIANSIWVFANLVFIIKFSLNFDLNMLILFSIYMLLSMYGVVHLFPKRGKNNDLSISSNFYKCCKMAWRQ